MMEAKKSKAVLVIFNQKLPQKNKNWWKQFDQIIAPENLKNEIQNRGLFFVDIETMVGPGSVQQAYEIINKIAYLSMPNGSRLSKIINWRGYELWWLYYDSIYYQFCLPYTQYSSLLFYLKDFEKIFLFQPPSSDLFRYFLKAYGRRYIIFSPFHLRKLIPLSLGVLIQLVLSFVFLPWLILSRPKTMIFTGDKFDYAKDYDFRYKFIYQEMRKRKIPLMEFVRSLESWLVILQHAWRRKRPVFYSTAFIKLIRFFTDPFGHRPLPLSDNDPQKRFWFSIGTYYLKYLGGSVLSIRIMGFLLQLIGIKTAIIPAACDRTLHEVLSCKLAGILTVGIQHGVTPKYFFISDFMVGFNGQKSLSLDKYGLWSNWWFDYYLKNSQAYEKEQLFVVGHMRPLEEERKPIVSKNKKMIKPLFISEEIAAPKEVIPFLLSFLEMNQFDLYLKFRPYRDGFELWLKKNRPDIYQKALIKTKILRGTMEEAITLCDVVIGSRSTAVLEGLLQLKPFVLFWTDKWGDYFDIKEWDKKGRFLIFNPDQLVNRIKENIMIPKDDLKNLQEKFFGDPHQNGSKWVVDQIEEFLLNKRDGSK